MSFGFHTVIGDKRPKIKTHFFENKGFELKNFTIIYEHLQFVCVGKILKITLCHNLCLSHLICKKIIIMK